jgi:hypothetical protein
LAENLIENGDKARARDVLLFSFQKMPDQGVPFDYSNAQAVRLLFDVGEKEKAIEVANVMWPRANELAAHYIDAQEYGRDLQVNMVILGELQRSLHANGESEMAGKIEEAYSKYEEQLQMLMR